MAWGVDLEMVDIDLPDYFTLRGDLGNPINLDDWGEIIINKQEIVPFERLEEKVRLYLKETNSDVTIELRKK